MNTKLLSLALLAAGLVGASVPLIAPQAATAPAAKVAIVGVPDPARQIEDLARLFRAGDLAGMAQAMIPPQKWEEARAAYERERMEPTSEQEREQFAENLQRLIAPDAVEQLMAEIEPKLEEARPQAQGALLMAFGAAQMALASPDTELSEEQRDALRRAMPGVQTWAAGTDFLSSDAMREALTLITDAARGTGITDLDQIKAMPLEAVLDRARPVFAAAKEAVSIYGIDLDAVVDTLQVEVLAIDGDTARVRTTITLFDAPVWADHDLVLVDGRWYGKQAAVHFDDHLDVDVDVES